jgi:hypothetical protein
MLSDFISLVHICVTILLWNLQVNGRPVVSLCIVTCTCTWLPTPWIVMYGQLNGGLTSYFVGTLISWINSSTKIKPPRNLSLLQYITHTGVGLDWGLRLINSILVISSCPEKWGRYSVTLACVTWFFYVLCDSRYTDPRFIFSSARVAFLHPKAEHWQKSEGYQWFKSLVVTGRGVEPMTYRSGSECSTSEPLSCSP